jgi:hypothetical protein
MMWHSRTHSAKIGWVRLCPSVIYPGWIAIFVFKARSDEITSILAEWQSHCFTERIGIIFHQINVPADMLCLVKCLKISQVMGGKLPIEFEMACKPGTISHLMVLPLFLKVLFAFIVKRSLVP